MKTSNKILLGMVVFLVLIPASILVALSIKVKNGDYTIKMSEWEQLARTAKPITNTGFMKIATPATTKLECTIRYSDSIYYRKHGSNHDSLQVEKSGDTLYFTVISRDPKSEGTDKHEMFLDIFMPFKGLLMLDGAGVTLDSVAADAAITVDMTNNSTLNLGQSNPDNKKIIKFSSLFVKGDQSKLVLTDNTSIDSVSINLNGNSNLYFGKELSLGSISGAISAGTEVNGAAKWIYQLKPMP
ncbi:hypothetical protein [Flavihumibacter sp. UBA7668]|uniref:hypothetical protein n=1 Tax=Flavihumibacter sp. UBA7668 TaxID=1946542 RepID=UPI0025BEC697|nr:hypothetical protein [Flavihumibacter sp. UBA7668]